jgi:hypothetical protein
MRPVPQGYISLGVEFPLSIYPTFNSAGAQGFNDCIYAYQKIILFLFGFDAVIEPTLHGFIRLFKRSPGAPGNFVPHENANFVNFLPFAIQSEKRTDFKEPGGNIEALRKLAPIVQIANY